MIILRHLATFHIFFGLVQGSQSTVIFYFSNDQCLKLSRVIHLLVRHLELEDPANHVLHDDTLSSYCTPTNGGPGVCNCPNENLLTTHRRFTADFAALFFKVK
jgi:hypothetical protein